MRAKRQNIFIFHNTNVVVFHLFNFGSLNHNQDKHNDTTNCPRGIAIMNSGTLYNQLCCF